MRTEEKKRLVRVLICFGTVLIAGLSYYFIIKAVGGGIPCPIYMATGIFCPGCGITRMFVELISGNFLAAISYNALGILLLPLVAFFTVRWSTEYVKKGSIGRISQFEKIVIFFVIALIVVFTVLRNIDAFSYLAPVR